MKSFLLIWLATQAVSAVVVWLFTVGLGRPVASTACPRVAVIIAVKGHDAEFDGFLAKLFEQDYPAYRVIFTIESPTDAALPPIEAVRARHPDVVSLVIAGLSNDEGQKTKNLRAAAATLRADDEIVVLADADIWPARDWLRRLVAPLVAGKAELVSGFAWLIPHDRKLSTLALTAMSASVATMPRLAFFNAAWGGSTAMFQHTFRKLGLPDAWRGTLSDDLQLTNLAQRGGCRIAAPREILLRTAVTTKGFGAIATEARRWFMLVRCHMPLPYAMTIGAMTFLSIGWLLCLGWAMAGSALARDVLVGAIVLGVARGAARAVLVARLWGGAGVRENARFLLADPLVTPFATALNAIFGWSALFLRRTTWAGTTYEMLGPTSVKILARADVVRSPADRASDGSMTDSVANG